MEILLALPVLVILAGYAGWFIGREVYYGGWGNRVTHSCGWFNDYTGAYPAMHSERPCPRCGKTDREWGYRVGRPVFPWGWEWQNDEKPTGGGRP